MRELIGRTLCEYLAKALMIQFNFYRYAPEYDYISCPETHTILVYDDAVLCDSFSKKETEIKFADPDFLHKVSEHLKLKR